MRRAADIPVEIAGGHGFLMNADTPALVCKDALGSKGGRSDLRRDILTFGQNGDRLSVVSERNGLRSLPWQEGAGFDRGWVKAIWLVVRVRTVGEASKFTQWRVASPDC